MATFKADVDLNLSWRGINICERPSYGLAAGTPFDIPDEIADAFATEFANGRILGLTRVKPKAAKPKGKVLSDETLAEVIEAHEAFHGANDEPNQGDAAPAS